ncbi:MAG: C39 family peptidase [Clostridia bacterium]|nr:C39 family peptidase [Clostridia bacterium]
MRKQVSLWVALALTAVLLAGCTAKAPEIDKTVHGNLLKVTAADEFKAGALENLKLLPDVGDGAVELAKGATEGTFTSAEYDTDEFYRMVACWNASIAEGGSVEVWARAKYGEEWTDWLTWGKFTPYEKRGTRENKTCDGARVDQDTFILSKGAGTQVQMKAVLKRESAEDPSPVLRQLSMTFSGGQMVPTYAEEPLEALPEEALCFAPAYSQEVRSESIADSICSPTTMTVMMNSRGMDILPEEYALRVKDNGENIFGSWSFTCAGAGLYGFECYCQYASEDILMQELAKGHTCGISVRYSPKNGGGQPKLDGCWKATGGHLIAIIGYEYEDGVRDADHLYFYSSDSFSEDDAHSYRRYSWKQLSRCWENRLAYIIPDTNAEIDQTTLAPWIGRENVTVESVGNGEYRLLHADGSPVDLRSFESGQGVIAYCVDGVRTDMTEGGVASDHSIVYGYAMQVSANETYLYAQAQAGGTFRMNADELLQKAAEMGVEDPAIHVYAMGDDGYCYEGVLE